MKISFVTFASKTYIKGTNSNYLTETLLMNTHNICYYVEIKIFIWIPSYLEQCHLVICLAIFFFRIDDEMNEPSEEEQPFCQIFKGTVCSTHVGNRSIYVKSRYEQGLKEDKTGGK